MPMPVAAAASRSSTPSLSNSSGFEVLASMTVARESWVSAERIVFAFAWYPFRLSTIQSSSVRLRLAIVASLGVRLAVLVVLEQLTAWPFWLILSIAFVASFLCSYLVSLFWVFRAKA